MYYFVSLVVLHKPVALLSHPCRLPVAFLLPSCRLPVAKKHPAALPSLSCCSPVALLSLSPVASLLPPCRRWPYRPPVVFLSLSCPLSCRSVLFPVASLSSPCRHPVAALSLPCCPPIAPPLSQRREYDNKTPRIGASGAEWSTVQAPGLDRPGEYPLPRTGASEATERMRQNDAPDWSIRGGVEHGTSTRTGSSRGAPGATNWNIRGNGENTAKRRPGLEHSGWTGARPKPPDWIVRGCTRYRGLDHPGTQRTRTGTSGDEAAREWNVRGSKQGEGDGGGETRRGEQEQEEGTDGGGQEGEKTRSGRSKRRR